MTIQSNPPGHISNATDEIEASEDVFFRGGFHVLQPVGFGHRAGLDALLIAAGLPENASGKVADLGSGSGVAAMAAVTTNPDLDAVLIEKNPAMANLARRTLRLRQNLKYAARTQVIEADVTLTGSKREAAGLKESTFDFVIMNPPYNHNGQRPSPDMTKAEAHVMGLFGLDAWMRTAVAILKPGGTLVLIYRTEKIGEVYACCQGRFGGLVVVPVHSHADGPAKRILVRMTKGSRAPLSIMPGLVMHEADGSPTEMTDLLLNGKARVNFG
jgi:tRNA1(Val) A37 N6-methylase TrmN6